MIVALALELSSSTCHEHAVLSSSKREESDKKPGMMFASRSDQSDRGG